MAQLAFTEEWLSLRASKILPYLAGEHEIHYIASGTDIPQADFASVTLFKFPRYQQQNSFRIANAVRKLYRQGKIDFVVDYSYMAWLFPKIPFIEISGGLYHNDFLPKWRISSWFRRLRLSIGYLHYCLPEHICIKRARQVITDNPINSGIIHEYFKKPLQNISIIPNGVDEAFSALYAAKEFVQPTLLFVGNLHPGKGILAVLRRFSERKDLDVSFIVCGDGPDRAAIETLVSRDHRISYRGRVSREELLEIEKQTSIFVFPSLAEGCPNALLEAMASGHACITYNVETIKPVIGSCGLEVHANQVDQVVDYCSMLLNDNSLLRRKAAEAHERSKKYSWKECAAQIGDVIRHFASKEMNDKNQ